MVSRRQSRADIKSAGGMKRNGGDRVDVAWARDPRFHEARS